VHTMMSLKDTPASAKPQEAGTIVTPSSSTPTAAPVSSAPAALPAAPTLGSAAAQVATSTSDTPLISAVKPPADAGQLESFSLFGGSYASGAPTLTLTVDKPVTLVNTADGTRYTLTLMPQGTAASAPASASSSTTTTTTTTGG